MKLGARRVLVAVALLGLAGLAGLGAHVASYMTGRGGRAVEGVRQVATNDGYEIVYYVRRPEIGAAKPIPIVLLASLARSAADWNELAGSLAHAGYQTLAIESRGIGGSDGGGPGRDITLHDLADDVETVLLASGFGPSMRAHVVGHAFGNRVARTFARDRPERVAGVALVAAGGLVPIRPEIERALLVSTASFLPWSRRSDSLRLAFFAAESTIPDDWRGGWWLWGGAAQIAANAATPSEAFWDAGRAPMLVIQAEQDTIAPPEDAGLRLLESFPDRVELIMVPRAGHALLPERPDRILVSLLDFFGRMDRRFQ